MKLAHNAHIALVDGESFSLFRNRGKIFEPELELVEPTTFARKRQPLCCTSANCCCDNLHRKRVGYLLSLFQCHHQQGADSPTVICSAFGGGYTEELEGTIFELQQELDALRIKSAEWASEEGTRAQWSKKSRQALREALRELQASMKAALQRRSDAGEGIVDIPLSSPS